MSFYAALEGSPRSCFSRTNAYARVSSHDQREDLVRQEQLLSHYCGSHGWRYQVISDLGSGMNYRKKRLRCLLIWVFYHW